MEDPKPSRAVEWLMLIGPILLLLPLLMPLFLHPTVENFIPAPILHFLRITCAIALFFSPLLLLASPLIALASGAFVYQAARDWLERGRTGNSIGVGILWAGPMLTYGAIPIWVITVIILG